MTWWRRALTHSNQRALTHAITGRVSKVPSCVWRYSTTASGGAPADTEVEKIILDGIKATGPLPFATYMKLCLTHQTHGYYMNSSNAVFGSSGDFITSPEISQIFGELLAIWMLLQWGNAGRPPAIRLVELGPGRGTLMDDILRTIYQIAPPKTPLTVHLVETSDAMRSIQEKTLGPDIHAIGENSRSFGDKSKYPGMRLHWHGSISEIPLAPNEYTMLVAHEFFDALPVHVLQKENHAWHEVLIASNPDYNPAEKGFQDVDASVTNNTSPHSRLRRVLSPESTITAKLLSLTSPRFVNLPLGSSIEVSPEAFKIARGIGELLSCHSAIKQKGETENSIGGCGLIIDYGGNSVFGNSLRAFKEHKIVDLFHRPGECDLTANVDFAYLQEAMEDLVSTHGPITQRTFLTGMGIKERVDALAQSARSTERQRDIRDAAMRLIDGVGMGTEYKVLGITSTSSATKSSQVVWPFAEASGSG